MTTRQDQHDAETKGKLITLDGPDGCGKATQASLLLGRLLQEYVPTHTVDFPRYDSPTGRAVRYYLSGGLGDATAISPRFASLLFAADRAAYAPTLAHQLASGRMVIADRYDVANKAHQGAKIDDPQARLELYQWLDALEFGHFGIPRPDLSIILTAPVEVSLRLIESRGRTKDGHETREHLLRAERTYRELAALFPANVLIDCGTPDGDGILPREVIHEKIWAYVAPFIGRSF